MVDLHTTLSQQFLDVAIGQAKAQLEVVPEFVDLEVAVPHLSPAVW